MSEAYDLRSNIKGKPGSQGTLFQVKDKSLLNQEQRYPRGYTPERQAEIRGALQSTTVVGYSHPVRTSPEEQRKTGRYVRYPGTEAKVVDALARSTMPAEHISGLKRIHEKPRQGHYATYWPMKQEMGVRIDDAKDADESLLHEMGHHADRQHTHTSELALGQAKDPDGVNSGVHEAVADNYYQQHYRSRGRKGSAPSQGLYEREFSTEDLDRRFPGYTDVRPPRSPLNTSQFSSETLF